MVRTLRTNKLFPFPIISLHVAGKTNTCAHPDEYIHIFVNNSAELMSFLEAIIHGATPDRRPASVVYNTLLELYLQAWGRATTTQVITSQKSCQRKC